MAESPQQLRELLSQARWESATEFLRQLGTDNAASAILSLPFEQQRLLFRHLPTDFAASLAGAFSYFHAYVLLHSLTSPEIAAIVDAMDSAERVEFLDALPEESWQSLMKTLEEARSGHCRAQLKCRKYQRNQDWCRSLRNCNRSSKRGRSQGIPTTGRQGNSSRRADRPVGRAEHDSRAPRSFGFRQVHDLEDAFRAPRPSKGRVLWHGKPLQGSHPNVAIVFQSFALFPWLSVLENVEAPLLARGMEHPERHRRALKALDVRGTEGIRNGLPERIVRRNETTSGLRAGARRRAGNPLHGRTVFRAGRAYGGESAPRVDGAVDGEEDFHAQHFSRDPQHRGSGAAGGSRRRSRQ